MKGLRLKPVPARQAQRDAAEAFIRPDHGAALRAVWIQHAAKPKPSIKRAAKGGIWKRDNKELYTALGIGAGAAALGGGIALATRGKAKPVLKPFPGVKTPDLKVPDLKTPDLKVADTKPAGLRVPNVKPMSPEKISAARTSEQEKAAAVRLARKKKVAESAKADEALTREASVKQAPFKEDPNLKNVPENATMDEVDAIMSGRKRGPNGTLVDSKVGKAMWL